MRVSIERDLGGTAAAPKTIRFFVPYWINNESSLSLTYRVVEIEPIENADVDSLTISKAVKSAKSASKYPSPSVVGGQVGMRKNIQVLESIEDTSSTPSMLSPQDYIGRGGVMLFSSRNDTYLSPRVGIAVAVQTADNLSPGVSLLELEKKVIWRLLFILHDNLCLFFNLHFLIPIYLSLQQRVDVQAIGPDGTYYKLSAVMHMTSDRTKVER